MYRREIEERIRKINETFRVLVVSGPRQVGKTTLLKSLMPKEMKMVSLDDEVLRKEAIENPRVFLETFGTPLFIDEIQYAPELFPYIKMIVDENDARGQYWLSGSQTFKLMKNVSETLAGRVGIVNMNSFTYGEIIENDKKECFNPPEYIEAPYLDVNAVYENIYNGGMPELYQYKNMDRDEFYNSYIDTYIDRDVRQIKNIGNLEDFKRFMRNMAIRNGSALNYSDIASDIGVSSNTIKEWTSILVNTRLIYILEPFHSNKIERLTHVPKIVFMDSGLATYLSGWDSSQSLSTSEYAGRFLEAYIVSEIVKTYDNFGKPLNISYFRNKEAKEIDLIIEKNRTLYPLEIKRTGNPKPSMIKNFKYLEKADIKVGVGGLICLYDKLIKFDENNYIIPISSVINPSKK